MIATSIRLALLLAAALALLPACALAAPAPEAVNRTLVEANGLQLAGKADAAIKLVEPLAAADPHNAYVLRMLGNLYLRNKQPERALATFARLLELDAAFPQALYGTAAAHVLRGETAQAFAWLEKARATRRIDMSMLATDANFARLHDDPRFAALQATTAQDFARPFIENIKLIREWDGEAANDQFGWIARGIGDVDGDGAQDFVTSAPTHQGGGKNAGRVYAYSSASGKLLWSVDGAAEDQLGTGLESAGDTDGDGVQDVIASAPPHDIAQVYSGKDGHVLLSLHGEAQGDTFGNHVASVGDIDRDGHADFIVGAPTAQADGAARGRAYVYSGKDAHVLLTLSGESAGDQFGSAVSGFSDGTHSFVVVGAPNAGARRNGRVYVYDGLATKPKFTFDGDATGARLGYMFLSVPGDVDGDAVPDIYASDWSNGAKGPATGRIYVYSGKTGQRLFALTGETTGEGFGTTKSVAGDVDGDGRADLIVGAWQYAGAAVSGGRAYLYSGRNARLLKTYTCRTPGDTFGFDAVGLGDVDHDGSSDLLVTSGWSAVHGFHSGRVLLISSGITAKTHKP
jgi:tetratricopeptide (TPR) repeat protein